STGACSNPVAQNGTTCNDGSACTSGETCQSGVCTPSSTKTCTAMDQCHVAGACDPASGTCSNPAKANGTSCDDGNGRSSGEICQTGICSGGTAKVCAAVDQCHVAGTCASATGVCSNPSKADGADCNADNSLCTPKDTCQAGVCVKDTTTVKCVAKDC